ncbi:transglycosylase SLT domain-containing protein [Aromatoleum bremense]|uniref:Transglycosylase SLT domain-containing protein n=1 Tax=Aromatoleum bremense TaxID=76115 RepID=A0ABX1NV90_9RHOO|nr:transglycosylase SLT domain-containing protein [Aromatoleum bremense]NMG15915.1 transglycosylase SLT domain-containing protein [Aromatoleum bremense]QTQ32470.1 Transglycosylase SLT domain-containing protein [Aromatoleum bremense]
MVHATPSDGRKRTTANVVVHFAQASLVAAGMLAAGWLGSAYLKHEPVTFVDIGVLPGNEAAVEVAAVVLPTPAMLPAQRNAIAEGVLSSEMRRVRDYVARRYKVPTTMLEPVLVAAEHHGRTSGIDPLLIVAMVAIESSFNPVAVSSMGAQGLMQVIPRFHMDKIGDVDRKNPLFDPQLNVRVGTQVLAEGLRRFGSLQAALQYYGGARSDPQARYANKVLAMKRRLVVAAGRGTGTDV